MNHNFQLPIYYHGENRIFKVSPILNEQLYCSYSITDEEGYLFTLVPTSSPFCDFRVSDQDKQLDQPIDWPLFEMIKEAVINHYM
jgi:hypothetical protein